MSKVIPFSDLSRLQHLNFLEHKRREYQEQEVYLRRLRKLLFQMEGQMRQAEILQLDIFNQAAKHFQLPREVLGSKDRLQTHQAFTDSPFLSTLKNFFADHLTLEEAYQQIMTLRGDSDQ